MTFLKNYLDELPCDIQDKIIIIVNKIKFNNCLKHIDNPKIRLFHIFNKMITDDLFELIYSVRELDILGWFWKNHENPMNDDNYALYLDDKEKLFAIYDLFQLNKRLSYKNYTKILPEYKNIKYYRFKYTDTKEFQSWEIADINRFITFKFIKKNYLIDNTNIIIKRFLFTKKYIHIYINKGSYEDNSAIDIAFNISHAFDLIIDCLMFLNNTHVLSFDNTIHYLKNNNYLESFVIKNNVLTTYFNN